MKVYNFSPGPSTLPEQAMVSAQANLLNYEGTGVSVMEMSHRSKDYDAIHNECISLLRELMDIPDAYKVLFMTGGATTQFEAIPLNLMVKGKADYIVTGNFANKAHQMATKYGDAKVAASSKDDLFSYIPDIDKISFRKDIDYVHITSNNTIFGTRYTKFPKIDVPLVADVSSNILSEELDVSKFGLLYAGAQKNLAPAGMTLVIVKESLIGKAMTICPKMLNYKTYADSNCLYNTPPTFIIYMAMLTLRWLKSIGGIKAINKLNIEKANILYNYIDNSDFYKNNVKVSDRSLMNIPFTTPSVELDKKFISKAKDNGLINLAGHRLIGGMRASIYNAMPREGVQALVNFMDSFSKDNR